MKWLATWIMDHIGGDSDCDWTIAMQREFDVLENGHMAWAAGCLATHLVNQVKTATPIIGVIILLPLVALIVGIGVTTGLHYLFLRDSGLPHVIMSLPTIALQLPFAILLGMVRLWRLPILVGMLGFASHQFFPQLLLSTFFDAPFHFWWGPNVTIYNMTPEMGYACSMAMWLGGAYIGTWIKRKRLAA